MKAAFDALANLAAALERGGVYRGVGYTNLGSTRLVYTNLVDPKLVDPTQPPVGPPSLLPARGKGDALAVFDYWCQAMGKDKSVLDRRRRRLITARLDEGRTVDELCRAIDGCKADPFSMGQNDRGTPFNDIALICRDAEHVEKFLDIANVAQGVKPAHQLPTIANPEKLRVDASAERRIQETRRLLEKQADETDRTDKAAAKQRLADMLAKVGKPVDQDTA